MDNCIFCKIIKGEIPSEKVYEDEEILAFKDINPAAPIHILVIPKKHIETLLDVKEEDNYLIGKIYTTINKIAKDLGIENLKDKKVNLLSGGQRQRVAIARALINDQELISADEPTGSLDTNTAQNIMNIFKELNKSGKTIIIVTHNMELAKETQKCVKIKDGLIYKV